MIKQTELRNKIVSTALVGIIGLLSACGGGGSSSSGTNTNITVPTLALFAGNMGGAGTADGTGAAARFNFPGGVSTDSAGNVYVADSSNNTIRKITPGKVVTTLAGTAGVVGSADGTGSTASFDAPSGIATDSMGNIYVADSNNNTIRKITPVGGVSTLAGTAGIAGGTDTAGGTPSFNNPTGIAIDSADNVYVADSSNHAIRKITPAGEVTTLAGSAGTSGSTNGTGAAARFSYPSGIATDSAGNIYVADSNNNTIRKITSVGVVTTLAGTGVAGSDDTATGVAASFDAPSGVTTDSAGNVYVADQNNSTIREITPVGVVTTLAGSAIDPAGSADGTGAAASFNLPTGIAADSSNNLYVADSSNHTIRKITPPGVVSTWAGTATVTGSADGTVLAATFNHPSGIATDSSGNVYVADENNSTVRKVSTLGMVTTLAGTAGVIGSSDTTGGAPSFNNPTGVATDSVGNIYVADSSNNTIRKITPAGIVSTLAGTAGVIGGGHADGSGTAASFSYPSGIATDSSGNVYVADHNNNTIRKITSAGVVTTLAGTAGVIGSSDGTGIAASFNNPTGVATDSAGNIYVADSGNHTVRKITPVGVVSTLAGSAGVMGSDNGDGVTAVASFNNPTGVATDSAGNVYVADQNNHTIRKITSAGVVSTVVGVAGKPGFTPGSLPGLLNYPLGVALGGTSLYIVTGGGIAVVKNLP